MPNAGECSPGAAVNASLPSSGELTGMRRESGRTSHATLERARAFERPWRRDPLAWLGVILALAALSLLAPYIIAALRRRPRTVMTEDV